MLYDILSQGFEQTGQSVCVCNPHSISSLLKLAHAICGIFSAVKIENFQRKKFDIFRIFVQNIDCWYTLESPR